MIPADKHAVHLKYRADIDGLRAVAVLGVVAFHAFPGVIRGGFIGVDVFFVISGFLISAIVFQGLDNGSFNFYGFYVRRIKRIFPALAIVLFSCCFIGWFVLLADEYKQLGKHIVGGVGFVSNFVLLGEAGYFDNSSDSKPLLHLWSLSIEEQFYIVWPLCAWLLWNPSRGFFKLTFLCVFASFFLNLYGIKNSPVSVFFSPQTRAWELLSGSLLAWVALYGQSGVDTIKDVLWEHTRRIGSLADRDCFFAWAASFFSFLGGLLLVFSYWRFNKDLSFPGKSALIPVLSGVLIIGAGSSAWLNRVVLSNKILVYFGLISFPLYLWHWPLLSFLSIVESGATSPDIRFAGVVVSIILAWLTYILVERPIRMSHNRNTSTVASLMLLMFSVGAFGYFVYRNEGFELRSSIKGFPNNKNELSRTAAVDDECLKYIGVAPLFPYCLFTDSNANATVAVIGDSHAHVAYPGIAEHLRDAGRNAILLANSGCPPFLGLAVVNHASEEDACRSRTEQLISIITESKAIETVIIFTRGPIYTTGTEPLTGQQDLLNGRAVSIAQFAAGAQSTISRLAESGKTVFYVSENPELSYPAQACILRPFQTKVKDCSVRRSVVLDRMSEYSNAFRNLGKVTFVDSLQAFCPDTKCIVFDEDGVLLYADDDHLSVAGSRFLVRRLLNQYLVPPAK